MTICIKELRGMNADLADKLKQEGLSDSDQFLEAAATRAGRKKLAAVCGVNERVILELANRTDLARIKGGAGVFADLLDTQEWTRPRNWPPAVRTTCMQRSRKSMKKKNFRSSASAVGSRTLGCRSQRNRRQIELLSRHEKGALRGRVKTDLHGL